MDIFEGVVSNIRFQNEDNGFAVIDLVSGAREETAVGLMPFLHEGERVKLEGEWTEHATYGKQFTVKSYDVVKPTREIEIEHFLGSGMIKGVGPSMAHSIVRLFGRDTLDILSQNPLALTQVPGIGEKRAKAIGKAYADKFETREALLYLSKFQISTAYAMRIVQVYGKQAVEILKQNPYRLTYDVQGIGFRTADRIAFSMGMTQNDPNRVRAGVVYLLREGANAEGHVYLPKALLISGAQKILNISAEEVERELAALKLARQIVTEEDEEGGDIRIYDSRLYAAEVDVAKRFLALLSVEQDGVSAAGERELDAFETARKIAFESEQRRAILTVLSESVAVITGGPGTGKTTVINCIIELFQTRGLAVSLAAPTGRAAKRMTEATGQDAKTLHRLLEYGGEGEQALTFGRDESNPLQADVIIVDEMSMVDLMLMRALLRAVRPGTRLVLVGDADQLPSVGAGNVLADIISSGAVPVVRLTQVFRQAAQSQIVLNAHRINAGEMPVLRNKDTDFFFERRHTPSQIADSVASLCVSRLPSYFGLDPMRGIQVLAPVKKGEAGVFELNKRLQEVLNPPSPHKKERRFGETLFRVGDKVMQTRNNYQAEWTRESDEGMEDGLGVFNGDMGRVVGIEDGELDVLFDDDRHVLYADAMLSDLELAYAITIHKSQGSEFDTVVLALCPSGPRMMVRNLLYTAVTRARSRVVLVGEEAVIERMIHGGERLIRYTQLARRLAPS